MRWPFRPGRRVYLALIAALLYAGQTGPAVAQATNYPDHPVRLVVGVPPGGTIDLIARIVGKQLSEQTGQTFIVENRAGAGGNIGAGYVAHAAPDGYTLFVSVIGTMAINPHIYDKLPFDPIKDFAAISELDVVPQLMIINPSVPARNLKEFIAYAKAHDGQINYASGGVGTATHMAGEMFNSMAGTHLVHVPFRGSAPAMTELLSGRASVMFEQISTALPQVRANNVRAMGVTTLKRSPAAPDIPSLSEAGLTGYDVSTWHGLVAPAGTPAAVISRLHDEVVKALASPAVQKAFADAGITPVSSSPREFTAFTQAEILKWRDVVKAAHVPPQ
jgi:tripartite-type tricarboxylate transporter receptor subunit TctC